MGSCCCSEPLHPPEKDKPLHSRFAQESPIEEPSLASLPTRKSTLNKKHSRDTKQPLRKSDLELAFINAAFDRHVLFKEMETDCRQALLDEMQKINLHGGEEVYQKDSIPLFFAVLTSGALQLGLKKEIHPGNEVCDDYFLADTPINVTVTAVRPSTLWTLSKEQLISTKVRYQEECYEQIRRLLFTASKYFRMLADEQVRRVAAVATVARISSGTVLVSEGECSEVGYLLREGTTTQDESKVCVGCLQLLGVPSRETVHAVTDLLVWKIEKQDADAALPPSLLANLHMNQLKTALESCQMNFFPYELNLIQRFAVFESFKQEKIVLRKENLRQCMCVVLKGKLCYKSQANSTISTPSCIRGRPEDWGPDFELPDDVVVESKAALVALIPLVLFADSVEGHPQVMAPVEVICEEMQEVPLLQTLGESHLQTLSSYVSLVHFPAGTLILSKGEMANVFYIIKSGFAQIGKLTVRQRNIGPGNFFGQQSWLLNQPMTDTVVAHSDLVCWAAPAAAFEPFLKKRMRNWLEANTRAHEVKWTLNTFVLVEIIERAPNGLICLVGKKSNERLYLLTVLRVTAETEESDALKAYHAIGRLAHPLLIEWLPALRAPPFLYFVIGCWPGVTLHSMLKNLKRGLRNKEARFYIAGLISILEHLHKCEVTYRDLRPETVIVDETGYPSLTDFRRCKRNTEKTYTFATSPWYTAPETIRREGSSLALDYWSLGVFLYECVYRKYPFGRPNQSPYKIYEAILIGHYEFPEDSSHDLTPVEDVIELLLEPNPAKRLPGGISSLRQHCWLRGTNWVTPI